MRNRELIGRYGPSGDLLFNGNSIFDVLTHQERQAGNAPTSMNDDTLLNTPTDDLVDRIAAQFSVDVPVLDRNAAWVESSEGSVAVSDYWSRGVAPGYTVLGTILRLHVPFSGDSAVFAIQPSSFTSAPPRAQVTQDAVVIAYSAADLNPQQAKAALDAVVDNIEKHLVWHRQSSVPFNEKLKTVVRTAVEARKAKVLKDRNSIAALGFNLKPRADAPKTYVAPVTRKPVAVKTSKAVAPFKPGPVLDEETYEQILKIMDSMAHVMERSPSAFVAMGEEALRQHFLVQLNGQFEGAATGETFNLGGTFSFGCRTATSLSQNASSGAARRIFSTRLPSCLAI
jgi:hypothetical protein